MDPSWVMTAQVEQDRPIGGQFSMAIKCVHRGIDTSVSGTDLQIAKGARVSGPLACHFLYEFWNHVDSYMRVGPILSFKAL